MLSRISTFLQLNGEERVWVEKVELPPRLSSFYVSCARALALFLPVVSLPSASATLDCRRQKQEQPSGITLER